MFEFAFPADGENRGNAESKTYKYIGPTPKCSLDSLVGHATRGCPVYDLQQRKVVYLKDTWRILGEDLEKEGDILASLGAHNAPYIPTVERLGDVLDHATKTQALVYEPWNHAAQHSVAIQTGHLHYRFVTAIADAVEVCLRAYEDAKYLHRDISEGNVLITLEGRGLLIDWDYAKATDALGKGAHRHDQTIFGERVNSQFMSAMLLQRQKQENAF
ncbi:hypothetical protein SCP_1000600 [Sparassis crispa]|uniref:Fungal-type protein kinase domain-containing protein n=1 Tax=Sparassis crispa TaxID=139825 RepID=A0A401GX57_9APHY|nr:hypothetical protein SCP_1000600 [Sparassis crispa]GBE86818.1 hypothetical protein SCP_1000600 [Sparassis crispa]